MLRQAPSARSTKGRSTPARPGRWPGAPERLRDAGRRRLGCGAPRRWRRNTSHGSMPPSRDTSTPDRPGPTATGGREPSARTGPARPLPFPPPHHCLGPAPAAARSPAATCRPNASGPSACAPVPVHTRSAQRGLSSPLWSTRPATSRIASSRHVRRSARTPGGRRPPRSSPGGPRASIAIVDLALVITLRTSVTMPPTTTRWPSSASSAGRPSRRSRTAPLLRELAHRVVRQVQPEQLLLPAQPLADGPRSRPAAAARTPPRRRAQVEQRGLAGEPVALRAWPAAIASSRPSRICAGWPNALSAPTLDQRLEHLACWPAAGRSGCRSRSASGTAALLARRDDRLDRALADVLDRQQPEPDRVALDRELEAAAMDVGRPDLDAHPPALGDRRGDLLGRSRGRRSAPRSCTRPCSSPSGTRSGRRSARSTLAWALLKP